MPNPSELERMRQENEDEMQRVSGTLNRDAFAYIVIVRQIEEQEAELREALREIGVLEDRLEGYRARYKTAEERITSLRDTLNRLDKPRD